MPLQFFCCRLHAGCSGWRKFATPGSSSGIPRASYIRSWVIEFEAMLQDLVLALRLQAIDRKIARLETEIGALPKHIAEMEKKLEAHSRRLESDRAALASNQRDRKKLDGDIQVHQQKISKLHDQMLGAKNNEQYKAFQNEIAYAEGEIRRGRRSHHGIHGEDEVVGQDRQGSRSRS